MNVSERPSSPKGHPRSRGVNVVVMSVMIAMIGSSPLTRGQRMMILTIIIAARVIPAHAGSTHSKPRNPANAATLAAATDITAHL